MSKAAQQGCPSLSSSPDTGALCAYPARTRCEAAAKAPCGHAGLQAPSAPTRKPYAGAPSILPHAHSLLGSQKGRSTRQPEVPGICFRPPPAADAQGLPPARRAASAPAVRPRHRAAPCRREARAEQLTTPLNASDGSSSHFLHFQQVIPKAHSAESWEFNVISTPQRQTNPLKHPRLRLLATHSLPPLLPEPSAGKAAGSERRAEHPREKPVVD